MLEEDGTLVETEEFFEVLEDNTSLMVLEKNQKWSHAKVSGQARMQPHRALIWCIATRWIKVGERRATIDCGTHSRLGEPRSDERAGSQGRQGPLSAGP